MEKRNTNFVREVVAGLVTFFTISYIIPVNAAIIGDSGGPCVQMFPGQWPGDEEFDLCLSQFKKDMTTSTCLVAMIGSLCMALWANQPFAVMPGMGMNAYFAYTVVGYMGTGIANYSTAVTAVFIEGIIFVFLSITGLRSAIRLLIPTSVQIAVCGGTGIFLAFIGMQASNGIGIVVQESATLVTLGGCPNENRVYAEGFASYWCDGGKMADPTVWLGLSGLLFAAIMAMYEVRAGLIYAIAWVSLWSWIRPLSVTNFPYDEEGNARWDYFTKIVALPTLELSQGNIQFGDFGHPEVWLALVTFLYTDLLDTTGTVIGLSGMCGFINDKGKIKAERATFGSDAIATVVAATLGSAPGTTATESAAGIQSGGRTGMTSLVVSFCFFCSLFFAPLLSGIPPWATGPALIFVGVGMVGNLRHADWETPKRALPTFVTAVTIPLTYSIAYGLLLGLLVGICLETVDFVVKVIRRETTLKEFMSRFNFSKESLDKYALMEAYGLERWVPDSPEEDSSESAPDSKNSEEEDSSKSTSV